MLLTQLRYFVFINLIVIFSSKATENDYVSPCKSFYEFACGEFTAKLPSATNNAQKIALGNLQRVIEVLRSDANESAYVELYKSRIFLYSRRIFLECLNGIKKSVDGSKMFKVLNKEPEKSIEAKRSIEISERIEETLSKQTKPNELTNEINETKRMSLNREESMRSIDRANGLKQTEVLSTGKREEKIKGHNGTEVEYLGYQESKKLDVDYVIDENRTREDILEFVEEFLARNHISPPTSFSRNLVSDSIRLSRLWGALHGALAPSAPALNLLGTHFNFKSETIIYQTLSACDGPNGISATVLNRLEATIDWFTQSSRIDAAKIRAKLAQLSKIFREKICTFNAGGSSHFNLDLAAIRAGYYAELNTTKSFTGSLKILRTLWSHKRALQRALAALDDDALVALIRLNLLDGALRIAQRAYALRDDFGTKSPDEAKFRFTYSEEFRCLEKIDDPIIDFAFLQTFSSAEIVQKAHYVNDITRRLINNTHLQLNIDEPKLFTPKALEFIKKKLNNLRINLPNSMEFENASHLDNEFAGALHMLDVRNMSDIPLSAWRIQREIIRFKYFRQSTKHANNYFPIAIWPLPYYEVETNTIQIPLGALQAPFYTSDALDSSNCGAIGALIGAQIAHVFGWRDLSYDENGNFRPFELSDQSMFEEWIDEIYFMNNIFNLNTDPDESFNRKEGLFMALTLLSQNSSQPEFFLSYAQLFCDADERVVRELSYQLELDLLDLGVCPDFSTAFQCANFCGIELNKTTNSSDLNDLQKLEKSNLEAITNMSFGSNVLNDTTNDLNLFG